MAVRPPRRPPQPPNRASGRKRVSVPSVQSMRGVKSAGLEYDRTFLRPHDDTRAALEKRQRDLLTQEAFELAREGDDSLLLPYQPTPSINPPRPRTLAAGYDREQQIVRVKFRDGALYEYYDVPPNVWRNFKRVKSPGRLINRTLNGYRYARVDDL